jgi:DNA-binding transcriptional LysR family regulator
MDIDIRLLRSFVAIFECGTLSRAAEKLACTQAAMSMRLKLIEAEAGALLFRRRHHRLEPTPAGVELHGRALDVLTAYDDLVSATRKRKTREKLRLGLPDDYALGILPRALERFGPACGYDLEIVCDLSSHLAAAMQQRLLNVALLTLPEPPPNAVFETELSLNWVMKPAALPQPDAPIPIAAYPDGCVFRRSMITALREARRPWHMQVESRTHAGIIAAVRAGVAVTSMAKGTIPAGLHEAEGDWELPPLPPIPVYLMGKASSHVMQVLKDELVVLGGEPSGRRSPFPRPRI